MLIVIDCVVELAKAACSAEPCIAKASVTVIFARTAFNVCFETG